MPRAKPPAHRATRGSAFGTCHTFVTLANIKMKTSKNYIIINSLIIRVDLDFCRFHFAL